jgi:hypothetical protein
MMETLYIMLTRGFLFKMRMKAIRRGVYFKTLNLIERGILSLSARFVDRVKSQILGVELVKILKKIRDALKSSFIIRVEEYGFRRVKELAALAMTWENTTAKKWTQDFDFAQYLTLLKVYNHYSYGVLSG